MKTITIDNKEIEISDELYEVINKATEKECVDWKPKEGEKYYYVNQWSEINNHLWSHYKTDNYLYNTGNCFKTYKQAKEYTDVLQAEIRVNNEIRDKGYRLKDVDGKTKFNINLYNGEPASKYSIKSNSGEKFGLLKDRESCEALIKTHGEDIRKVLSYNIWK